MSTDTKVVPSVHSERKSVVEAWSGVLTSLVNLLKSVVWLAFSVWFISRMPAASFEQFLTSSVQLIQRVLHVSWKAGEGFTADFNQLGSPDNAFPGVTAAPGATTLASNQVAGKSPKPSPSQVESAISGIATPISSQAGARLYDFSYKLNPVLPDVQSAKFFFDHPTMPPPLQAGVSVLPGIPVSYRGWGCLHDIKVEVTFNDGTNETVHIDGCAKLGWK